MPMLWIRVARPADWTGTTARMLVTLGQLILLIAALLSRVPRGWADAFDGNVLALRVILLGSILWGTTWLRGLVYSRLPSAPYAFWRMLVVRHRGKAVKIPLRDIADVHVELRPVPVGEIFVVSTRAGGVYDLCPVHWEGAARLFAVLRKQL